MAKTYKVMISSTVKDLTEHREAARIGCEMAEISAQPMMEHLNAEDADAVEVSLRLVEEADIYIGIFAMRYGWIPPNESISITEMEYRKAVALGKPRLIFFSDEEHLFTAAQIDKGPEADKLQALKDEIGVKRVAAFFKNHDDLAKHIIGALHKLEKRLSSAEGAIPQDRAQLMHRISAIPAPPTDYIAHPYTLKTQFVGRQGELKALSQWVSDPTCNHYTARIFAFIAIGGMGKSALTWHWFREIAPQDMGPLAGRLWWSFYESDADMEAFLTRATAYVTGRAEEEIRKETWETREAILLFTALDTKPFLFVLDGLERDMIAYAGLGNHNIEEIAATAEGQRRLRQMRDPRAGRLLQKLAQQRNSRILISSRLYPAELGGGRPARAGLCTAEITGSAR